MNVLTAARDSGVDPLLLLKKMEGEIERRLSENRLAHYRPYPKQLEFHALGATKRERLLRAGNQLGKTLAAGMECAMHMTGLYPDWWTGRRWDRPTVGWVGCLTAEALRDGAQKMLLGRGGEDTPDGLGTLGTGTIPKKYLHGSPLSRQGVADAIAIFKVRHVSGGISTGIFKTYDQGRERWQADSVDWVWFDEEPPEPIYTEGLTRTNATGGIVFLTFTPLLGMSAVVRRFIPLTNEARSDTVMTIDDAMHIPAEQRQIIIDSYPEHEREARTMGVPSTGSGRVFPVTQASISWEVRELPKAVRRLIGVDFGWDHPTAAVWLAYDVATDIIYVTDAYRRNKQLPEIHAITIKAKSKQQKIPVAWPHDGLNHDKTSGQQVAVQYRDLGLEMLPEKATFLDGSNGVEAGVSEMLSRMETGRLKVAAHLSEWFEEFRLYRREPKGSLGVPLIVKEYDDLLDATRYGIMCMRYARVIEPEREKTYRANGRNGGGSWLTA